MLCGRSLIAEDVQTLTPNSHAAQLPVSASPLYPSDVAAGEHRAPRDEDIKEAAELRAAISDHEARAQAAEVALHSLRKEVFSSCLSITLLHCCSGMHD